MECPAGLSARRPMAGPPRPPGIRRSPRGVTLRIAVCRASTRRPIRPRASTVSNEGASVLAPSPHLGPHAEHLRNALAHGRAGEGGAPSLIVNCDARAPLKKGAGGNTKIPPTVDTPAPLTFARYCVPRA